MTSLITAPIKFAAGAPVALTEAVLNVFSGSDAETPPPPPGTSVYELASPKLDLCCLIYFYTELRSATKDLIKEFAAEKTMSYPSKNSKNPTDVELLYNALSDVDSSLAALETSSDADDALAAYKESLVGLKNLTTRFQLNSGDVEVFKQYFQIVSKKPKSNVDIRRDLHLYFEYISPQFRLGFGGTEFNIKQVEDLVKRDESSYIHYIDDDFTKTSFSNLKGFFNGLDSELVYAIAVSDKYQTVSVVFRGSVNANDWISNFSVENGKIFENTECKFPGFTTDKGMKTVERKSFGLVHKGFYDYLFEETNLGSNGSTKSKGEEIMGMLTSLVQGEKKGYKIHITGHSLGGALSTLMAARAAALNDFNTTIINVSFASPFVGDQKFRESFYGWEKSNNIKHLRMSNYEDVVPLMPFTSFELMPVPYKHTGLNIKMFNKSLLHPYHHHLSYPKEDSLLISLRNTLHTNLLNGINVNMLNHLCDEYSKRLDGGKEDLKKLDFYKLYSDTNLTGWEYDAVVKTAPTAAPEEEGKM